MQSWIERLAERDFGSRGKEQSFPLLRQFAFGVGCTAAFVSVRTIVDQIAPTAGPFALIYPAVLIATLFGRWQAGLLTLAAAMAWTWFAVLPRSGTSLLNVSEVPRTIVNVATLSIILAFAELFRRGIQRAVSQRDEALRQMAAQEAELRQMNASLETRVDERSAQLMAVEETLRQSQKLEAIGQLTGGVAHDFNNLLTVITGSVELLKRADLPEGKHHRFIEAIGASADRAAKLTKQLLAFARRQALKPEVFELNRSAEEIGTIVRSLTGSRISLEIRNSRQAVFVCADRSQFDTTIVNLAVNARDAMNGEGSLVIATGPVSGIPAIRAHAPVVGDYVAITVTDTGIGITPEQLAHIFEPFFTTKNVGEGTGLGLSQALGFAKQSNGDIRVESTPGKGSTFTLYLPRVYPDGEISTHDEQEHEIVDGEGLCVLVVEDNPEVATFATSALKELGYDSVMEPDAERALARLAATADRFHIVFSDVVMPGMSGLEMGERIRELYPNVPVILTSGYSHVLAENGQHGFELLHKPYSIEQLSRVLRKAIAWQARR